MFFSGQKVLTAFISPIVPIEIKCPTPGVFKQYSKIESAEKLYKVSKAYYYQCFGHMMENKSNSCLFVAFDPMQRKSLHIVEIDRVDEVIEEIDSRLFKANYLVNEINNLNIVEHESNINQTALGISYSSRD